MPRKQDHDHRIRRAHRQRPHTATARPARPGAHAGRASSGKNGPLRPERIPERVVHAKGPAPTASSRSRADVTAYTKAKFSFGRGQAYRGLRPLLHGRRRARLGRHRPRPARLRAQVLHRGRQLRHGRQQHAGLLHPRSPQIPGFSSTPRNATPKATSKTPTCSGISCR